MAKKKKSPPTAHYTHESAERTNIPTSETQALLPDEEQQPQTWTTRRRKGEPPTLAWDRRGGGPSSRPTRSTSARRSIRARSSSRSKQPAPTNRACSRTSTVYLPTPPTNGTATPATGRTV